MKNLVFTYIFDGYDNLLDPVVITPGWDYLCLSDNTFDSKIWKPLDVSDKVKNIQCPKRKASLMKIEQYKYVPSHYDLCMSLDGSMQLSMNLNEFIDQNWEEDTDLIITRHPKRDCIYDEALIVMRAQFDSEDTVFHHMQRYLSEGYPRNNGLYSTRMMLKNNKSENLRRVCEIWAHEYRNGSRRDQLSLNYAIWKGKKEGIELKIKVFDFNELFFNSGKFIVHLHNKRLLWP